MDTNSNLYQYRRKESVSQAATYFYHLMFVINTGAPDLTTTNLGIVGDVMLTATGIFWYNGAQWMEWENTGPVTNVPKHPVLPGDLRLAFNPQRLALVWVVESTVRGYRRKFNLNSITSISSLQSYAAQIEANAQLCATLSFGYKDLRTVHLSEVVKYLLGLYKQSVRTFHQVSRHVPSNEDLDSEVPESMVRNLFSLIEAFLDMCLVRMRMQHLLLNRRLHHLQFL